MITTKKKKELLKRSLNLFKENLSNNTQYKDLKTKLRNVNGKTGQYSVPIELYQQRTSKDRRVLIEWKIVMKNQLTMEDLSLFEGAVVVAFINNDYFDEVDENFVDLFNELKGRLGSDEKVSSMILLKTEDANPSSRVQREAYNKLVSEFPNHQDHLIKRDPNVDYNGQGNESFKGFIYYNIRGGQQEGIYSHEGLPNPNLFNPAVEYASKRVCTDIDLTLHFFILKSIPLENRGSVYDDLIIDFEEALSQTVYPDISSEESYDSLLDYCYSHSSLRIDQDNNSKYLYDPIQIERINLEDFANKNSSDIKNMDLSHNIPVNFERIHVDKLNNEILSASRPTNLFWSRHLSNMMQQNSTLTQYFKRQEELVKLRNEILHV